MNPAEQSHAAKEQNFNEAAQEVGSKMQTQPQSVTQDDASYLQSREARLVDSARPPKDSISSDAQSLATANAQGTTSSQSTSNQSTDPAERSHRDKERNYQEAVKSVSEKLQSDPSSITQEDGDLLHSREHRAHGHTESGGFAAEVQSLAAKNEQAK